jgi:hypothetical protein
VEDTETSDTAKITQTLSHGICAAMFCSVCAMTHAYTWAFIAMTSASFSLHVGFYMLWLVLINLISVEPVLSPGPVSDNTWALP